MNNFDIALKWLDMGIGTIPCNYRSKRPLFSWDEFKTRLPTIDEINKWYQTPFVNIAAIMGFNNLAVIDFDNLAAHNLWLSTYGQNGYADTYTVSTGRGYHYYYYVENFVGVTLKWYGGECKFSGYVMIPNSIHPSGRRYEAICPDNEIMTIGSLNEIFPAGLFDVTPQERPKREFDPFATTLQGYDVCADINQSWRILDQFNHARKTGDGWYAAKCVFHDDKHASAWIDDKRNRYGCHSCINGSLSAIDFYMKFHSVDVQTALRMMR